MIKDSFGHSKRWIKIRGGYGYLVNRKKEPSPPPLSTFWEAIFYCHGFKEVMAKYKIKRDRLMECFEINMYAGGLHFSLSL